LKTRTWITAACIVALLGALTIPASSLPGPVDQGDSFTIVAEETTRPVTVYDRLDFSGATWDFGDRDGYECVNIELHAPDGTKLAQIDFEQSKDYVTLGSGGGGPGEQVVFRWNDRNGAETGEGPGAGIPPLPCGNEVPGPPGNSRWTPSGEDHFPHFHLAADDTTHGLDMFTTDPALEPLIEAAEDELLAGLVNDSCDRFYPTPGDEPGEIVLWWDVDFPENGHHDGTDPLDCGGGGGEPVAVGRAYFAFLAPSVGVCILDHDKADGAWCSGVVLPEPSPSPTTPPPSPSPTKPPTPSPTKDPSPSPSPSETPSPSPSETPSPSPSPSETQTPPVCVTYTGYLTGPDGELRYFEVCV
jgi:hypothetical protein